MSNKIVDIANFNVVFLEDQDEAPLLKYFDSIVVPAFQSGIKKVTKNCEEFFMNVEVIEDENAEYVLAGNIIKKTILEVKSDIDERGKLVDKDEKYPSAPYSTFAIYLKNHRMIYVLNQKGSPSIKNFMGLVKYVFSEFIKRHNNDVKEINRFFPYPHINIVGIPLRSNIEEALKKVYKINKLTLKFYPLNGDQEFGDMFGTLTRDLRNAVGCKSGEIGLNSPKSISGIIDVLEQSGGTVIPIIDVTYPNKSKGRIKQDEISEKMEMSFSGENVNNINDIISKGNQIKSLSYVSEGNLEIYNKFKDKIIEFVPKK